MEWDEFNRANLGEWLSQAEADMKGKSDIHAWKYSASGLPEISPFLTQDEAPNFPSMSVVPTLQGVCIEGGSPEECNMLALRMLENGASCLWITVRDDWNPEVVFKDIYLEMITTIITVDPEPANFVDAMHAFLQHETPETRKKIILPSIFQTATHRPVLLSADMDFGSRAAQLRKAVTWVKEGNIAGGLFIHVQLKADFMAQIAELRNIRMLTQDITQFPESVFIAATTAVPKELKESIHPLIPVCYQLLSAWLGMSSAAFGMPVSEGEELARLSLNIQHIFTEEGKLDYVSDPMAGSYLTDSLCRLMQNRD